MMIIKMNPTTFFNLVYAYADDYLNLRSKFLFKGGAGKKTFFGSSSCFDFLTHHASKVLLLHGPVDASTIGVSQDLCGLTLLSKDCFTIPNLLDNNRYTEHGGLNDCRRN
jgi:hypothetical protein